MAKKQKTTKKINQLPGKIYKFTFHKRRFSVMLDDVLIFRFFRQLHGRFWGLAGILGLIIGIVVCFAIRPDMLSYATPVSDFGRDVRTAPYFAGSVFFAAYGLWRWRNYLARTLKRTRPILALLTFTIVGLYMVALFPVSWQPWPYRLHFIGVTITGVSIAATVVFDILLSKTRKNHNAAKTRAGKMLAFFSILIGGWLTFGSSSAIGWFNVALIGELFMLVGYAIWIGIKTYQGEDPRSALSRQLKHIVFVD
jgi:hypothetical protein